MKSLHIFALLLLVAASAGCTATYEREDDYKGVNLPTVSRHPVAVELRMTEEFRSYVYEMDLADKFAFAMGRTLTKNAQRVASATFEDSTNGGAARGTLTPRIVSVDELWDGSTTWANAVLSVEIEWRLEDLDGNLVWLGTEVGRGEGNRGVWVKSASAERLQTALDEVFARSAEAISGAATIATWAR